MTDNQPIHFKDITIDDHIIGLTKLTGKQIAEVSGYLSGEFGDVTFKVCEIIMADGSHIAVEGEHDFPYLSPYSSHPQPNLSDNDVMERLYDEEDAYDFDGGANG